MNNLWLWLLIGALIAALGRTLFVSDQRQSKISELEGALWSERMKAGIGDFAEEIKGKQMEKRVEELELKLGNAKKQLLCDIDRENAEDVLEEDMEPRSPLGDLLAEQDVADSE
jgi:hypothetical protein